MWHCKGITTYQNREKFVVTLVCRWEIRATMFAILSSPPHFSFLPARQQFIVYLPSLTLGPAALPKNTLCQPNFLNLPSRRLFLTSFCQDRRSSSCFLSCFPALSWQCQDFMRLCHSNLVQHISSCFLSFFQVEYTNSHTQSDRSWGELPSLLLSSRRSDDVDNEVEWHHCLHCREPVQMCCNKRVFNKGVKLLWL